MKGDMHRKPKNAVPRVKVFSDFRPPYVGWNDTTKGFTAVRRIFANNRMPRPFP